MIFTKNCRAQVQTNKCNFVHNLNFSVCAVMSCCDPETNIFESRMHYIIFNSDVDAETVLYGMSKKYVNKRQLKSLTVQTLKIICTKKIIILCRKANMSSS
jgi:hypothetical protein